MIDEMTIFQVEELAAYWHRHPPVHLLVAGFVGYKVDEERSAEHSSSIPDYYPISTPLPPQFLGIPGIEPGALPLDLPPAILDAEELMRQ